VKAEQTGFKSYEAAGIILNVAQVYNLPVKMSLGALTEQITVEANPVQVEQTEMQLGTTVTAQQIVDLPLNGRNWTQLQQLQPGVVGTTDRFGGNGGGYSGNGAESQQNSFLINGVDSNDASLNTALIIPSPDSIGEFRMVTNTLNPEYGRNSGTIVNATIKNGTNQFHGSGFEFYRDTFLDAKNYFETKPSPFHQNEYGGTVGGPIIKDRAFFFFSYQGYHNRIPEPGAGNNVPVFGADQRTGDFSATDAGALSGNAIPFAMYGDNASSCPVSGGVQCQPGPANTFGSLFSTGVIPTEDLNPLAVKLTNQFVPLPNAAANSYLFNPTRVGSYNQYLGRIDEKVSSKDSVWFYGLWQSNPYTETLPFTGSTLPGMGDQAQSHEQQYSASWTHTFNPTTLNELRVGYTRNNFAAVEPINPINPTTYGFTGITPQVAGIASLPVMNVSGYFTLGFSANGPQPRIQNTYQAADNFSKVHGRHTIKAGVNFDRGSINNPFYNNLGGNYSFGASGPFTSGDAGIDFLLGIPDGYIQGSGSIVDAKAHELYAYVQDQWQIRPNLTITYGTGYDVYTPWLNHYGNGEIMGAFRPGQQSTVFPTAPVGFVYPGDAGINKYGGMKVRYDLLAPRLGFAWSPGSSHNFSVHGGIGLYYNRSEEELALQTLTNAPFAITTAGATTLGQGSPAFVDPFTTVNSVAAGGLTPGSITNPFPFSPPVKGASPDFTQYYPVGLGFNTEDPRFTAPRSTNFNLTIERQLDKSTILSIGYVGNRGRHEEGAYNLNIAGTPPGLNPIAAAAGCTSGLSLTSAPCPQTPYPNPGGTPIPGATPLNLSVYGHPGVQATEFNSKYDSLQITMNRHFTNGLQVTAAYTWSRYFDQTSNLENSSFNAPGINSLDPQDMWAPSQNDAPQRFVTSYTYTLPIYKYVHKMRALTDGWNLVGIYTLQHGTPIPVFDLNSTSLTCDLNVSFYFCPDRANRTGAPLAIGNPRNYSVTVGGVSRPTYWFSPAAFSIPPAGTGIGNATRNPLYGPGINYGDMAIEKRIFISESKYFELRLETFNTFNHTNFANPATPGFGSENVSSSRSFGRIFSTKTLTTNGEGRAVQLGAKFYF
jgi:hypothetical protein